MNRPEWEKIGIDKLTDKWVYSIQSQEINIWIENQPVHMWKYYDIPYILDVPIRMLTSTSYVFTTEMEAWFTLRWT
jgi:hypothetical protein